MKFWRLLVKRLFLDNQTNPDVSIAFDTLKSVSREIQAEGWSFNKEHHYPLTRDNNKEIAIPNNMLQLDVGISLVLLMRCVR